MSVYKPLNSQDIIVSPFEVNKAFTFTGGDTLLSESITRYLGINNGKDPYYNSIKQLYYSNYISGSNGNLSNANIALTGSDNILYGPVYNTLYQNYLSTDLPPYRYFPIGSEESIGIISIPQSLYGDFVQPQSLIILVENISYVDDGEGRLFKIPPLYQFGYGYGIYGESLYSDYTPTYCGNIIYEHGIIILTNDTILNKQNFISSSTIQLSFSSSYSLYETQYKCTFSENEFNYTLNPSILSESNGTIYNQFTSSYFSPYITTIGLYNESRELMMIGKFSQPIPTSRTTDMTILLNIDKI